MIGCSLNAVLWPLFFVMNGAVLDSEGAFGTHPDHGAPFVEQLSGQWVISTAKGEERRLRMYDDGRFAFMSDEEWTAGSYVILRTDERQKGVLRMEYYLDGNLHLQELRCEIYFEEHARDHSDKPNTDITTTMMMRTREVLMRLQKSTTTNTCRLRCFLQQSKD